MNSNQRNSHHAQFEPTNSNPICDANSSRREMLGSKALNLSSKLLTKSANYLSSKNLDSLANPLNRVKQAVLKPSPSPSSSVHRSLPSKTHFKHKSNESWQEWDNHISNWNLKVGGQPVPDQTCSNSSGSNSIDSIHHNHSTPPVASSSSLSLSYFHPQNWQKKPKESAYTEDHLVCFPGFVALRSPSYSRAGDIEVFISIHAFRAKPTLDHLNRSQRLIHSMICKMTGLPPLPVKRFTKFSESTPRDSALLEHDWIGSDDEQKPQIHQLEPPLPSNSTPTHNNPSIPSVLSCDELNKSGHTLSAPHLNTQLVTPPAQITYTAPTPIQPNLPALPLFSDLSRSSSVSSSKSSHPFFENERPSSDSNSILASNLERLNQQFSIENQDLSSLHLNLKERLHSFFSQSSESSKVRLKIYGICSSKATKSNILTQKSLFRSRVEEPDLLTPELDPDEFIINNGRPLLTQVITTRAGGVWEDKLVLPWQTIETHLSVNRTQTDSQLLDSSLHSRLTSQKTFSQTGVIRLRIEAELINDQPPSELRQKVSNSLLAQTFKSDAAIRKLSIGKPTLSMELDVIPALAESVHVISDIDDTIKHTNVLGGLKHVFQHVFLAGFDQVSIVGMAEWYQSLRELGCWIHYISNSPLELWYCIEGFLAQAGFPRGSVSLKEYARGATSILSGMWESAGSRKRARVEAIIKQFPNSRFICVGDSGEQDLEMYVSLAQAYPGRIISIYIRDVTSPAILGKEICIDQILSRHHRFPSSDRDAGHPKRASRFGMGVLTSRPCSPFGEAAITGNGSAQHGTNRSTSYDVSCHPNLSVSELSIETPANKPKVPPKPSHLSSKRASYPNAAADVDKLPRTQTGTNKFGGFGLDPSFNEASSRPSSVYTYMGNPSDDQTGASSTTEKSCFDASNSGSGLIESNDPKAQSLLDAFINRVQKARYDINQLNLNPNIYPNNDQQDYFDNRSTSNEHLDFIPTKLQFFRNGRDLSVLESIQDVRKMLHN